MLPYWLPRQEPGEEPRGIFTIRPLIGGILLCIITIGTILYFSDNLSFGSHRMKLDGQETVTLPYNGGILSIYAIEHGEDWRIVAKFSSNSVTIDSSKLQFTDDEHLLNFRTVDEYGHIILFPGERTVRHGIIYFDVSKHGYKAGDKIELIINKGFIHGIDYVTWSITRF